MKNTENRATKPPHWCCPYRNSPESNSCGKFMLEFKNIQSKSKGNYTY